MRADHFIDGAVQINFAFFGNGRLSGKVRHASGLERVCHVRLVEPHRADGPGFIRDRGFHDGHAAAPAVLGLHLFHHAGDRGLLAGLELGDRIYFRKIFVARGEVPQKIVNGFDAHLFETAQSGNSRSHYLKKRRVRGNLKH